MKLVVIQTYKHKYTQHICINTIIYKKRVNIYIYIYIYIYSFSNIAPEQTRPKSNLLK